MTVTSSGERAARRLHPTARQASFRAACLGSTSFRTTRAIWIVEFEVFEEVELSCFKLKY